jgi:hypothetical protein
MVCVAMLSCILACAVAVGSSQGLGPSRLEQGEAALERGELSTAASEFSAHYRGLSPEQRASQVGEYVVMYAAEVYDQAYAKDGAIEHLESSRELLATFVRDVEGVEGNAKPELTKAARAKIEELDQKIAKARPAEKAKDVEAATVPPPEKTVPVLEHPPIEPATPDTDPSGPDRVSVALIATGATLAVGGIAMLAAGLAGATERRAESKLEAQCEADGATAEECTRAMNGTWQPYLDRAERSDRMVAIASVAPLVVGTALLIVGGVRLARDRNGSTHPSGVKGRARVDIGSWVVRDGAGAVLSGRF